MGTGELLQFFVAGMALGSGPCLAVCLPVLLPYIAMGVVSGESGAFGNAQVAPGWKTGLKVSGIFSLSRLAAYTILGGLAVLFYKAISALFSGGALEYVRAATGILVIAAGTAALLKPGSNNFCRALNRINFGKMWINSAVLGFLIGIAPCWPLYGALGYLAAMAPNFLWGVGGGFAFGLGTVISPLIPLGVLLGHFSEKTIENRKAFLILRIVSGIILLLFGLRLILTSGVFTK